MSGGELIARLEAAEAGSRELDAAVFRHFGGPLPTEFATFNVELEWQDDGSAVMPVGDLQVRYTPPAYTTSLDAALALAERVLPGCFPGVQRNRWAVHEGPEWSAFITPADGSGEVEQDGPIPTLALCIAILRATPTGEPEA